MNGQGSFNDQQAIASIEGPISIHFADIDSDNDKDVFTASFDDDKISFSWCGVPPNKLSPPDKS